MMVCAPLAPRVARDRQVVNSHHNLLCCCLLFCTAEVFMLIGSFAATAVLVYGAPEAPLSQPRNVVGGHMLSAFIGLCIYKLSVAWSFGYWLAAPLSVSLAIVAMQLTKTLHPPGGATAMIVVGRPVRDVL
jgi:CBS domain-containing membrane protein